MTAVELADHLQSLGVNLSLRGGKLHVSAPKGALAGELRSQLTERKAELIALLLQRSPIPRRSRSDAPLSFTQERLWFLEQLQPGSAAYNISGAVRLRGALSASVLEQALGAILARHEALRTTFRLMDDRPVQVVSPVAALRLPVVDLTGEVPERREAAVTVRALAEARLPFNLAAGPLFRAVLYRLAPDDHVLLICMHHIISDGWSLGILVRELGEGYRASGHGEPPALSELPIQYADYAEWQRDYLQGVVLDQELAYWRGKLPGLRPLELPTDRPRPAELTLAGAQHRFRLPATLTGPLRELARRTDTTLFMVLLASFKVLLARYTGQDDVAVGSPIAGRNRTELEGLIGFFVNTLVLRTDLAGEPTFRELLGRVRETCLSAYAHQELPFEKLVEDFRPERDLSRNPLFQVMFALQNLPRQTLDLPGLTLEPVEWDRGAAQFDLTLYLWETPEGLKGLWEYSTDLFDRTTIQRMARHYEQLLAAVLADPTRRLSELPLLTDAEQAQLAAWNATAAPYPREAGLLGLLAEQVERQPEATALRQGTRALTYAALDAAAARLADFLGGLGVGPGALVGVCLDRTPDLLVALLGVLKAGGAYVPLDPAYPAARLAFMVENSGAQVVLTQTAHAGLIPPGVPHVVCLERDRDRIATAPARAAGRLPAPDDLAYVIYTSGSTGQPKGVEIAHGALVNLLTAMAREPGCTAADVLVAVTTLSFDIAALELFLPLICGGTVVLATREEAGDPQALRTLLGTTGTTVMQATPATWRMLLEAGWSGTPGLTVLCGGEALPRDLANALQARAAEVWNVYGPTETTIWSAAWRVEPGEGPVPIGRPLANTQMYVVDRGGNPQPVGVVGELAIGGDGLARGYRNRPDLTAERFVPDPFTGVPGARLYRTGDLARWWPDGTIECLGRMDHQVKIRGFRIELGEIETALQQHPGVRQAVVVARPYGPGDYRLVAYVVGEAGLSNDGLQTHLRGMLPEYMVPVVYVFLDTLPLTPNGKVDRKALPAPDATPTVGSSYVAPRTPLEASLAQIWAEVLRVERVGVHDNFFEIGGHSLLAVQLVARVRQSFGVEVPLRRLFDATTLHRMAEMVEVLLLSQRGPDAAESKDRTEIRL